MEVVGQAVVLDDATIFRLVLGHNAVGAVVEAWHQMHWLSVPHVFSTVGRNDVVWYAQADCAIDTALSALVVFVVGVEGMDVIAKKPCATRVSVGNQCFGVTQFQLEVGMEVVGKLVLNGLRCGFGAGESDQPIISVANVPKPAEVGIKRVAGRDGLCLFIVGASAGSVAPLECKMCRFGERNIGWIGFP